MEAIKNDVSPAIYRDTSQVSGLRLKLVTVHTKFWAHLADYVISSRPYGKTWQYESENIYYFALATFPKTMDVLYISIICLMLKLS